MQHRETRDETGGIGPQAEISSDDRTSTSERGRLSSLSFAFHVVCTEYSYIMKKLAFVVTIAVIAAVLYKVLTTEVPISDA